MKAGHSSAGSAGSTGSLTRGQLSKLDQVRLFEQKYDVVTRGIIERLPIVPAWRCLELGAGAGSMSYWLASEVTEGAVLAVDVDTSYLDADRAPNLTVEQRDVTQADYVPGSFDLILARAVLEHVPEPSRLLENAVRWLAPGGWLVVEDFYYLSGEDAPTSVGRAIVGAYVKRMTAQGADLRWARRLPTAMRLAGLAAVDARLTPAGPGQSAADNELISLRLRQEGHTLVENGLVSAAELAEFIESLDAGEGWDVTTLVVSAWGRKPA